MQVLTNGIRIALGMVGLVALVVGALVLIAPLKTASIIAAVIPLYVIVAPFTAARLPWLFLGVSLIVLGLVQVVRAFSLKPIAAVQVVRGEIV